MLDEMRIAQGQYVEREFGWMRGRTIASVGMLSDDEMRDLGWFGSAPGIVVTFTDGTYFVPMQDSEGNGPGFVYSGI